MRIQIRVSSFGKNSTIFPNWMKMPTNRASPWTTFCSMTNCQATTGASTSKELIESMVKWRLQIQLTTNKYLRRTWATRAAIFETRNSSGRSTHFERSQKLCRKRNRRRRWAKNSWHCIIHGYSRSERATNRRICKVLRSSTVFRASLLRWHISSISLRTRRSNTDIAISERARQSTSKNLSSSRPRGSKREILLWGK